MEDEEEDEGDSEMEMDVEDDYDEDEEEGENGHHLDKMINGVYHNGMNGATSFDRKRTALAHPEPGSRKAITIPLLMAY